MKKIGKIKRSGELMWVLGVFMVALGVSLCKKADLGVSMIAAPTFILHEAISKAWTGVSVGVIEYLWQGVLLILMCAAVRRVNWRYLLTFLVAVIYGYVLDMWLLIFGTSPFPTLALRWIMLIVGDVCTAIGVACFFRTYLPLQVHELFVAELSDRYKLKINKVKYAFDAAFLALSLILAFSLFGDAKAFDWKYIYSTSFHSLGLGTIITTIINAPIIAAAGKLMDKFFDSEPLFPKLQKFIGRKKSADPVPVADGALPDAQNADNPSDADISK